MVLTQVGEHLGGEVDRVGAMQDEGVGGDLHGAILVTRLEHPVEGALQVDRLGVVRSTSSTWPPTTCCTVPSSPQRLPADSSR